MFSRCLPVWERVTARLRGRPSLRYLEIGVFEGESLLWMLDNVLTHPDSRATCIDVFRGDCEARFRENLMRSGWSRKVEVAKGHSQRILRRLPFSTFDAVYVDASVFAEDVLTNVVLSWDLLKEGGLLLMDDYGWGSGALPPECRPGPAIDAFLAAFRDSLRVVHKDYQVVVEKKRNERKQGFINLLRAGPPSRWKRRSS